MAAILPLVKKYDAAVIALPNDARRDPDGGRQAARARRSKIVDVATDGVRHRRRPTSSSTRWPCRSAPTPARRWSRCETMRRIRDEFGVNMTCGASNVSFGMPDRHTLGAAFLPMAMTAGLTSAIMDARTPQIVEAVKAADLLLGHDEWGMAWIAAHRAQAGRRDGVSAIDR